MWTILSFFSIFHRGIFLRPAVSAGESGHQFAIFISRSQQNPHQRHHGPILSLPLIFFLTILNHASFYLKYKLYSTNIRQNTKTQSSFTPMVSNQPMPSEQHSRVHLMLSLVFHSFVRYFPQNFLPFNKSPIILKKKALFRRLFAQTPNLRLYLFGTNLHQTSFCDIQHTLLSTFSKGISIRFLWIPGHVDILGNSKADELARAGSSLATVTLLAATVEEATSVVADALVTPNLNGTSMSRAVTCTVWSPFEAIGRAAPKRLAGGRWFWQGSVRDIHFTHTVTSFPTNSLLLYVTAVEFH